MSLEITTALYERIWAILETGLSTPPLVRVGNRIKYGEVSGWLMELMHGQPSDFPTIAVEVGRRGTHSAYEYAKTLGMEDEDFDGDFDIERTEQVVITLRTDQVVIGGINPLKEAVLDDLMRARCRLGMPSLIVRFGPFATEQKMVALGRGVGRGGEAQVTTIQFPVVMVENGRATLLPTSQAKFVSTAENSATLASILTPELIAAGYLDGGFAQNGTFNNASPAGSNSNPPNQAAWVNVASVAATRGLHLTVAAEELLNIDYPTWRDTNPTCVNHLNALSTGIGYMLAAVPGLKVYVEHQMMLGQDVTGAIPAGWAAYMAAEAAALGNKIAGWTDTAYFAAASPPGEWEAERAFVRNTANIYYPGLPGRMLTSARYADTGLFVGLENMQKAADHARTYGMEIEWWSANQTDPMPPEALAALAGL